jgi:hypothetical protein
MCLKLQNSQNQIFQLTSTVRFVERVSKLASLFQFDEIAVTAYFRARPVDSLRLLKLDVA